MKIFNGKGAAFVLAASILLAAILSQPEPLKSILGHPGASAAMARDVFDHKDKIYRECRLIRKIAGLMGVKAWAEVCAYCVREGLNDAQDYRKISAKTGRALWALGGCSVQRYEHPDLTPAAIQDREMNRLITVWEFKTKDQGDAGRTAAYVFDPHMGPAAATEYAAEIRASAARIRRIMKGAE